MTTGATDPWWEVSIPVPTALVDDAGALFIAEGALGCEQQSADTPRPTFGATPAAAPRPVTAPGLSTLLVSFDGALDRREVEEMSAAALLGLGIAPPPAWDAVRRTDVDWAERWKEHFHPLQVSPRVWIVPSWEHGFRPPAGATVITLDPGLAFGTGQHATTALCLELLDSGLAAGSSPGRRVLDVGCGSGILAVAAALLGCEDVLAIDNDLTAVAVTHENIAQNGVGDVVRASGDDLRAVAGAFDWVLANIITPVLVELAEPLVAHTAPGGALVLSGVLATQEDEVLGAMRTAAARLGRTQPQVVEHRHRDEWIAVRLRV